jgi:hypothetical protein
MCQLLWPLRQMAHQKLSLHRGAAHAGLLAAQVIMLRTFIGLSAPWFRDSHRDKSALSLTLPRHTAGIHQRSVIFKGQCPDIAVLGGERDFVHALGEPGVPPRKLRGRRMCPCYSGFWFLACKYPRFYQHTYWPQSQCSCV